MDAKELDERIKKLEEAIEERTEKLVEKPTRKGEYIPLESAEEKEDWELLVYGKEKTLPELLGESAALEQRIKKLEEKEEKIDKRIEGLVEKSTGKGEYIPLESAEEKEDLENPPE